METNYQLLGWVDVPSDNSPCDSTISASDTSTLISLIATAADVARFFEVLFYEVALLEEDTLAAMLNDPLDNDYGFAIEVIEDEDYGLIYRHSGSVLEFTSDARYFVDLDVIGVLLHADLELDDNMIYEAADFMLGDE